MARRGRAAAGEGASWEPPARLAGQLRKTQLCSFFLDGRCKYGAECDFAHTESELMPAPDFRNMHMCKAFLAGRCKRKHCRFAHGEQELRPGSFIPPSTPSNRTRLSARSALFTPASLQPVRLDIPVGPRPLAGAPGLPEPAAGSLCARRAPQAHSGQPGQEARSIAEALAAFPRDPAGSIGEALTASPRGSVASAGASDADARLSQSSWDAMLLGAPMHL